MNNHSQKLWKKAWRYRWLFALCPFVRDVYVVNSVARGTASETSDIDLFIVTDYRKVAVARFFLVLVTQLFRLRVHRHKIAGRLCLSFFVDSEHADLQQIMFNHDPLLTDFLATKKLLFTSHNLGMLPRLFRSVCVLITPEVLLNKHTQRAIVRSQKSSFSAASIVISPSVFKFHENDQRRV